MPHAMRLLPSLTVVLLVACGSGTLDAIDDPEGAATSSSSSGSSGGGTKSDGGDGTSSSGGTAMLPDGGVVTTHKRGLAYGYHSDDDLAAISAGVGWWYNWTDHPDDSLSKSYAGLGIEYVPMQFNGNVDTAGLAAHMPADSKYLLTFNEPNFGAQANLTPEAAAAKWPEIEAFADQHNLALVSPAVNYCGGDCNETDPYVWLQKFFAACPDCRVDYVAMHWYACSLPALTGTLAKYESTFGKPLWLTEFSCLDEANHVNDADELAYMHDAVTALEADPMVFRYAWFTGRNEGSPAISVLGASGQLTALGQQYVTLPQ